MITSMMRRALLSGDGSTLNVDFTTGVLDSRLTFTRGSNATFINSSGLVQYAASNQQIYSQDQSQSGTWVRQELNGVDANVGATTDPQGGNTASKLRSAATLQSHLIYSTISTSISSGLAYTFSVYVKKAELKYVALHLASTARYTVVFDLDTGLMTTTNSTGTPLGTAYSSQDAGNGWWRLSATMITQTTTIYPHICLSNAANPGTNASGQPYYTGVLNDGVYTWGAQLNAGSTPLQYIATTTAQKFDQPRFDHDPTTLSPRGLAIEGAATNLINWSETFDTTGGATNWNWSALNVTRGTVTTTNPTGASATVIKIEETTANGIHAPLIVPTVLASTTYTFSVWAKAVERTFVQLFENGGSGANSMVDLSTGAIVSESTAGITTVTAFGTTGWYRISMRLTTIVGQTTANCQLRLSTNGTTTSYAGTTGSGIYIWGAQLEAGSGASSYIPTGASQVQRLADTAIIAAGSAFTSWYTGDTSGTFYADWHGGVRSTTGTNRTVLSTSDVVNRHFHLMQTAAAGNLRVSDFGASFSVTTANAMTSGARTKGAFSFNLGSVKLCLNGGTVASGSVLFTTAPTYLVIGGTSTNGTSITDANVLLNGSIRQIKYWPTILPDAQLQSITT